jgi:hypothetical protein
MLLLASIVTASPVHAASDVLDQSVSLRSEADLVLAVTTTLQHAIATSQQFHGKEPRLRRFANKEIKSRNGSLKQLGKLATIQRTPVQHLAVVPQNEQAYIQGMLRNHARLIELIEHGVGLPVQPKIKRIMESLSRDAMSEFAMLIKLEKS